VSILNACPLVRAEREAGEQITRIYVLIFLAGVHKTIAVYLTCY